MKNDHRSRSRAGGFVAIAMLTMASLTFVGIVVIVAWLFEPAEGATAGIAVAVMLGLGLAILLALRAYAWSIKGKVLYDCGGRDAKKKYLWAAGIWLLVGLAVGGLGVAFRLPFFAIAVPAFGATQAVLHTIMAHDRLLVCEGGILCYGSFFIWNNVLAHRMEGDGNLILQVRGGNQFGPMRCSIPADEIPALAALLNERIGKENIKGEEQNGSINGARRV